MPLSNDCRGAAALPDERRQRHTALLDEQGRIPVQYAPLQGRPPRIAPREKRVTRGRADARRRVCVGKTHPLGRQLIQVWRRDLRIGVIAAQITIAEIIGKDDDEVGVTGCGCGLRHQPSIAARSCFTNNERRTAISPAFRRRCLSSSTRHRLVSIPSLRGSTASQPDAITP